VLRPCDCFQIRAVHDTWHRWSHTSYFNSEWTPQGRTHLSSRRSSPHVYGQLVYTAYLLPYANTTRYYHSVRFLLVHAVGGNLAHSCFLRRMRNIPPTQKGVWRYNHVTTHENSESPAGAAGGRISDSQVQVLSCQRIRCSIRNIAKTSRVISGQFGLHVTVMKRSICR
jgi:hypothetical protein